MGVVSHWLEFRAEGRDKRGEASCPAALCGGKFSPGEKKEAQDTQEVHKTSEPKEDRRSTCLTHQSSKSSDRLFQRGDASWLGHLHTRAGTTGIQPSQIISPARAGFLVMLLSIYPYSSQWSQQNHRPTKWDLAKSASSVCALSGVNPDGERSVTSRLILLQPWGTVIHKTVSQINPSLPSFYSGIWSEQRESGEDYP